MAPKFDRRGEWRGGSGQPVRLTPDQRRRLAEKNREIDRETLKEISVLDADEPAVLIDSTDLAEKPVVLDAPTREWRSVFTSAEFFHHTPLQIAITGAALNHWMRDMLSGALGTDNRLEVDDLADVVRAWPKLGQEARDEILGVIHELGPVAK